jgi:hypothetical protein
MSGFGNIRRAFEIKYVDLAHLFTSTEIKDRFDSILRKGIKIVRDQIAALGP